MVCTSQESVLCHRASGRVVRTPFSQLSTLISSAAGLGWRDALAVLEMKSGYKHAHRKNEDIVLQDQGSPRGPSESSLPSQPANRCPPICTLVDGRSGVPQDRLWPIPGVAAGRVSHSHGKSGYHVKGKKQSKNCITRTLLSHLPLSCKSKIVST